jgi:hypothetical protein
MYTSAAPLRARSGGVSQNDALRYDVLPVFDVIRIGGPPVLATCSRPGGGEKANFGVGPIPRDREDRAPFATRLRAGHPPRAFPHRQPKFAICASAANEATTRVVGGLAFPLIGDPPRRYSRVRVSTCFSVEYAPPNMTFRRIPRRGSASSVFFRPASRAGPIIASIIFPLHLGCSKEIPRERR